MTKFQRTNQLRSRRRGATIIEFALITPVILGMLLGIMEFGWLVKNHLTLANATREGARAAGVGSTSTDTRNRVINGGAPLSFVSPNGSIVLQYSLNNDTTYQGWPADLAASSTMPARNGVPPGKMIKITSTSKHKSLTGFFPFLQNRNLQVSVVMRREP